MLIEFQEKNHLEEIIRGKIKSLFDLLNSYFSREIEKRFGKEKNFLVNIYYNSEGGDVFTGRVEIFLKNGFGETTSRFGKFVFIANIETGELKIVENSASVVVPSNFLLH